MRSLVFWCAALLAVVAPALTEEPTPAQDPARPVPAAIEWKSDYKQVLERARELDRPVMLYFWAAG